MKTLFIVFVGVLIISMINCLIISIRNNNRFSGAVANLILSSISAMLFYAIHLVSYDKIQGLLLKGLFFANLDWTIYFMIRYVHLYTDTDLKCIKIRCLHLILNLLLVIDSFFLIFNAFFLYTFDIEAQYDSLGDFFCWKLTYKSPFFIHVAFCYVMIFYVCYVLIRKAAKVTRIYRRKYLIILLAFSCTCFLNTLRMAFDWTLDVSVLFYAVMVLTISHLTFWVFPKEIEAGLHYMVAEHINGAVICFDLNGTCMYISRLAKQVFPNTEEGRQRAEQYRQKWIDTSKDSQAWEDRIKIDGMEHVFAVEYNCLRDKHKKIEGSYIKLQDRTDEVIKYEKEKYKASHDVLTGLYNRTTFFEKAEEIIRNHPEVPRYLIATNIKDFRLINDLFGSEFGDRVIKEQARMLSFADYEDCIKGRISADKFAMLIAKKDYKPELAEKNTGQVQKAAMEVNYKLHMHVGIYEIKNAWEKVEAMYDKAYMAIESIDGDYERKLVYYDASMMEQAFKEKYIVGEFPKALEEDLFEVIMNPQVNSDGKVVSHYIELEWEHSVMGRLKMEQFMPIVEKSGYSYLLDQYVWKKAIRQLWLWMREGRTQERITIVISPRSIYYVDVCDELMKLVEQYHVAPSQIYLEFVESAFRQDSKMHLEMLSRLQKNGFRIAINSLGSGFSSLNLLKDIRIDVLKLDKEFLRETENEKRSKIILNTIITMAKKLGIKVVADGVETKEQMDVLVELGCVGFQGTYFTNMI